MTIGIIVIVIVVLIALWFINQSNQLNRYQVSIEESKKNIDIILVKRYSEMLKVAKSYAKHEEKVFTELVTLRQGGSIQETNQVLANQNDVLTQIRAVGESYPELFSSKQFENLQREIAEENEDLAASKRIVNSNVRIINQAIVSFPTSLVASIKGLRQFEFLNEDTTGKRDLKDLDYNVN